MKKVSNQLYSSQDIPRQHSFTEYIGKSISIKKDCQGSSFQCLILGPNGKTNEDCLTDVNGFFYSGNLATTPSGRTCQRWDQQAPHSHSYGFLGDQNNFCRNPNDDPVERIWCYTMDSGKRWESCAIDWPMCMDY